jgi:hypothetical protein
MNLQHYIYLVSLKCEGNNFQYWYKLHILPIINFQYKKGEHKTKHRQRACYINNYTCREHTGIGITQHMPRDYTAYAQKGDNSEQIMHKIYIYIFIVHSK